MASFPGDKTPQSDVYDAIIIGGGPGGSTVATLLANAGKKVLVIEREKFPRFSIGESLMPESYWVFKRLGVLEKLKATNFVRKYSVQFVTASGKESQPFFFDEMNPHECSVTWQVVRSEFDKMLLDNAAEHGAEVWEESNVIDVLTEPSDSDDLPRAVGVVVEKNGQRITLRARVIVDATGTRTMLAKRFGIRQTDPSLRKASYFSHYKGGRRDPGKNEGATLVLSTANNDGWFWYIPLPDDTVSVGVVGDIDRLVTQNKGKTPEQILEQEIKNCRGLDDRMTKAVRVGPVHVLSDFSYRATRCAGDGWVLVGDAFGFLDPMYSSGVFLALKSAEMAADTIVEGLEKNDTSARQLSKWGDELSDGMTSVRKLVYAFYTRGFSFGKFVRENPGFKKNLVDLLIGNVFYEGVDEIFIPMSKTVALPDAIPLEKGKARQMAGA